MTSPLSKTTPLENSNSSNIVIIKYGDAWVPDFLKSSKYVNNYPIDDAYYAILLALSN